MSYAKLCRHMFPRSRLPRLNLNHRPQCFKWYCTPPPSSCSLSRLSSFGISTLQKLVAGDVLITLDGLLVPAFLITGELRITLSALRYTPPSLASSILRVIASARGVSFRSKSRQLVWSTTYDEKATKPCVRSTASSLALRGTS